MFFVSHSTGQVKNLCERALVLKEGRLVLDSTPVEAEAFLNRGVDDAEDFPDEEDDF